MMVDKLWHETRCYINVHSKADKVSLIYRMEPKIKKVEKEETKK